MIVSLYIKFYLHISSASDICDFTMRAIKKLFTPRNVQQVSQRSRSTAPPANASQGQTTGNCLSQPLPGLPVATYVSSKSDSGDTKVTVLDNGIRVASEKRFGQFCTVGVAIDSGSRLKFQYSM